MRFFPMFYAARFVPRLLICRQRERFQTLSQAESCPPIDRGETGTRVEPPHRSKAIRRLLPQRTTG
jgi:hypothetical protein